MLYLWFMFWNKSKWAWHDLRWYSSPQPVRGTLYPQLTKIKRESDEQNRDMFLNTGACVELCERVDTVECCCTWGSEGKHCEWNYSRCSNLLQGVCYRNGPYGGGGEYWTTKKGIQQQRMFAVIPRPGSFTLKWTDQMQTRLDFL